VLSLDRELVLIVGGATTTLVLVTALGLVLGRTVVSPAGQAVVVNLNARIRGWWVMCLTFLVSLLTGGGGCVVLFALISALALREFVSLTPTRRADHRSLCWAFWGVIPLQYGLVATGRLDLASVAIPVGAFTLLAFRGAAAGDPEGFLERTAAIHWGLMICVYGVSHVPALLALGIPGYEGENVKLVVFLILVAQWSDILQYVWGKWLGRTPIAPTVSPHKTWEGFFGGAASATLLGTAVWWITPFTPGQAGVLSLVITLLGFAGGLILSAVKRDRGVKDYGTLLPGHGGILDRIDSLCLAAPVFFHLARYLVAR
jgi:phosphatidate cytidylyltransferase